MNTANIASSLVVSIVTCAALFAGERPLATLQERCRKMLALQTAVHKGTLELHRRIAERADKQPTTEDRQAARKLAASVKESIAEATATIARLEKDGAAVAFPEVVQALRDDLKQLQSRLEDGDVGSKTQTIARDVVETLTEMVMALKKRGR